jgi:SAM-dependent methyltransferase
VIARVLPHSKALQLSDFAELTPLLREIYPHEVNRFGPDWPAGREYRKDWEVAMAVRALQPVLTPSSRVLGVGAGTEPTLFYLTNHVREVHATDLYLADPPPQRNDLVARIKNVFRPQRTSESLWHESANRGMFLNPGRYWPGQWNPRRLIVQHMNGLDLRYEDETFDAVFSSGSIEHFGGHNEVRRAVSEMRRVLKPGGILSVSTEFRMAGPSPGLPGVLMFDEKEIAELFSPESFDGTTSVTPHDFAWAIGVVQEHTREHGDLLYHKLTWPEYPIVALKHGPHVWTSCHIALRVTR